MCDQCKFIGKYPPPPLWDERGGSDRLFWLNRETCKVEGRYISLQEAYLSAVKANWRWDYPSIPPAAVNVSLVGDDIPASSGVYFVWRNGGLSYVGQTKCLKNRCRYRAHDYIEEGDRLSWLLFPEEELLLTEAFYIGVGRPWANFGLKRVKRDSAYRAVAARRPASEVVGS